MRHFVPLLLTFFFGSLSAQSPIFQHFTLQSGLPSPTVYYGLQGEDGSIWLATENGVSRFDGFEFENWGVAEGLPDQDIIEVWQDSRERVWATTMTGEAVFFKDGRLYDREAAPWLPRTTGLSPSINETPDGRTLFANLSTLLAFDSLRTDTLAFLLPYPYEIIHRGNQVSLLDLKGNEYEIDTAQKKIKLRNLVTRLPVGWQLIARNFKGGITPADLAELQQDSATIDRVYQRVAKYAFPNQILGITKDSEGIFWVGTKGNGVYVCDPKTDQMQQFLKKNSVSCVFEDKGGNFWITTLGDGIYFLRVNARNFLTYQQNDGLAGQAVLSLAAGVHGELYIGYAHMALTRLEPGKNMLHHYPIGPTTGRNRVTALSALANGAVVAGTDLGSFVIRNPRQNAPPLAFKSRLQAPFQKVSSNGNYSFITNGAIKSQIAINGQSCFQAANPGASIITQTNAKPSPRLVHPGSFYSIAFAKPDSLFWLGSLDSLFLVRNGKLEVSPFQDSVHSRITDLAAGLEDKMWIATAKEGILLVEKGRFHSFDRAKGLPSNFCTRAYSDSDGTVWVGTDQGLSHLRFDPAKKEINLITNYTEAKGLSDNFIHDIVRLGDSLWIATPEGVSFFNPAHPLKQVPIPCIQVSKVQIRGKDTTLHAEYDLSYWQNSLRVRFQDPCFTATRYQYRLLDSDTQWIDLAKPEVNFPLLPPGRRYTIEARAQNSQDQWSSTLTVAVNIRQQFYKTWWFPFLLLLIGFGLILAIFIYRQRNLRKLREKEDSYQRRLAQIRLSALKSQMNPHFLFNSLNSIQHLITENDDRNSALYVSRLSRLLRRVLEHSEQDFISLEEEIKVSELYLKLEAMRLMDTFTYSFSIPPDLPRHQLLVPAMIFQPFLENAIWHGLMPKDADRSLKVEIQREGESLLCVIEDNGIGREAAARHRSLEAESHTSQALRIFGERLALLNQTFEGEAYRYTVIDLYKADQSPAGTRVEIYLPRLQASSPSGPT